MNLLATLTSDAERSTRARVARAIGEDGPVTASDLAATLGLTPAAVRRHLDAMLTDGLIAERTPPVLNRRPGRPAKAFVLSAAGHAAMTNAYDDLAVSALRFVAARHGREAVREFAAERVAGLERRYADHVQSAGESTEERASALAGALSDDGYAASTRPVGGGTRAQAVQLCQGHCPVQHVAAEFPELCEAEAAAFSRLLGVHVQRLATLAQGAHVCTTHVPVRSGADRRHDAAPAGLMKQDRHDTMQHRHDTLLDENDTLLDENDTLLDEHDTLLDENDTMSGRTS